MGAFLDLNDAIGGYDIDGQPMPERHSMSPELAGLVYRVGGVIGRGALAETPVLDLAPYLDLIPVANIHEAVRPFVVRDRLREQTGQDASQSIWRGVLTQADGYPVMEDWLARSEEHTSELQSLMRISYAVFCLKKKKNNKKLTTY